MVNINIRLLSTLLLTISFYIIFQFVGATKSTTLHKTVVQTHPHFYFSSLSKNQISFSGHFPCIPKTNNQDASSNFCVEVVSVSISLKSIIAPSPYQVDYMQWNLAGLPGNIKLWDQTEDYTAQIENNTLLYEFSNPVLPVPITGILLEGTFTIQSTPIGHDFTVIQLSLHTRDETSTPFTFSTDCLIDNLVPTNFEFHQSYFSSIGKEITPNIRVPTNSSVTAPTLFMLPTLSTTPPPSLQPSPSSLPLPASSPFLSIPTLHPHTSTGTNNDTLSDYFFHFYLFSIHNPNNVTLTSINVNLIGQMSFRKLSPNAVCNVNGVDITRLKLSIQTPPTLSFSFDPTTYETTTIAAASDEFANILTIDLSIITKHYLNTAFTHTSPVAISCQNVFFFSTSPIQNPPNPTILNPYTMSASVDFFQKTTSKLVLIDSAVTHRFAVLEHKPHPIIKASTQYLFGSIQITNIVNYTTSYSSTIPESYFPLDTIQTLWQGVILEQFNFQRFVYAPKSSKLPGSLIYQDTIETPFNIDFRYRSSLDFVNIFPQPQPEAISTTINNTLNANNISSPIPIPESFITTTTIKASQINLPKAPRTISSISQMVTSRLDDPDHTQNSISYFGQVQLFHPLEIPFRQPPEISFKSNGLNLILPFVFFPQTDHMFNALTLDLSFPRTSAIFHSSLAHCTLSILEVSKDAYDNDNHLFNDDDNFHYDILSPNAYPPFDSEQWVELVAISGYDLEETQQKEQLIPATGNNTSTIRFILTPMVYDAAAGSCQVKLQADTREEMKNPSADEFCIPPFSTLYLHCNHIHIHTNWEKAPKDEILFIHLNQLQSETQDFTQLDFYNISSLVDEYEFSTISQDKSISFIHRGTSLTFQFSNNDGDDDSGDDQEHHKSPFSSLVIVAIVFGCLILIICVVMFIRYICQRKKTHHSQFPPTSETQLSDHTQLIHSATPSLRGLGKYDAYSTHFEPLYE